MEPPAWDDPELPAGTMVRGGLWLMQVVGLGNTFTKGQLREAFPGVSQVDRRIRDLRDFGWVLHSSAEDASLLAEDQRFVKVGVHVWDPEARREAAPQKAISSKERHAVFARDGHMCTLCGIAGGETYPDDAVMTAVLAVSRRAEVSESGAERVVLVTECKRCRAGRDDTPVSVADVVRAVRDLDDGDRRRMLRWIKRGRRGTTDLDRAWAAYLRISKEHRSAVATQLGES